MKNKRSEALIEVGTTIVEQIKKKENPSLDVPVRALSNVIYDKKEQRLLLGPSTSQRFLFNIGHLRKFLQTLEVAAISKNLVDLDKHASLRDVFYMVKRTIPGTKINVVDEQKESDTAIEDLETVTNLSREMLNINANKMGSVAGKVTILDKGDEINWSKLGSGGWSIPSNVEDIEFKKIEGKFIIYMEKQAVWERLHEDKYWEKHNCIIVTSQGQTTRGIRRLLRRMNEELNLPVFVLADFDPWGFYIYSVLKYGSINLAHESERMTVPTAKFLGITADDIEDYDLKKHFIKFKEVDVKRIKQMKAYDWFKSNKAWQRQFNLMLQFKAKAEIQALSGRGLTFISDQYLPEKIERGKFIE